MKNEKGRKRTKKSPLYLLVNNQVISYLVSNSLCKCRNSKNLNISLILHNHESNKSFLNKESEALKISCFRKIFPSNVNHNTVNICTTCNFSMCPNFQCNSATTKTQ